MDEYKKYKILEMVHQVLIFGQEFVILIRYLDALIIITLTLKFQE